MTDSLTPPAQAMTAEMEAARKVWWNALSRRGNPQSLTSNYRSFAAGYEAASAAAKVREQMPTPCPKCAHPSPVYVCHCCGEAP